MRRPLRCFFILLSILYSDRLPAQSQPQPRSLPYEENFDALSASATAYPDGWQGWTLSGSPGGSFNTATPSADKALTPNGSASGTANGVYNYSGKLGFLNSGSADNALVLAVNTSGQVNITVSYDAMTIRNPYDGSANTRINEMGLQYRIGDTGSFTNVAGTAYQNNTVTQTGSGITQPQQPLPVSITLPAACNNQPLVQLRWVNRQISGSGSRPSFAVDNILVKGAGSDVTPPVINSLIPANQSVDVSPATPLQLIFNENIAANQGNLYLHNNGRTDTFPITHPALRISNNQLTLNKVLRPYHHYYITIDSALVKDLSGNAFAGISDSTQWYFTTGAQQLNIDFNTCTPTGSTALSGGFTQYSVQGAQTWACTTFGQNNSNAVQINGFSGGAQDNEDWLISPAFDLSSFQVPLLHFSSRTAFTGPALELKVSTDYSGSGDPRHATWHTLNGRFPAAGSDVWNNSESINLSGYKAENVYIAFIYTSSPALQAARWTIDDFSLKDTTAAPAPTLSSSPAALDFDYIRSGQQSAPQAIRYWANDFTGDLQISVPTGFRVSGDSSTFSNQLTIPLATLQAGPQQLWVKFVPTAANTAFIGNVAFKAPGFTDNHIRLTGTSLRSLKVVNWNIEWFGSPVQNPANDSLQQANVTRILQYLDADIFALAEVVDTARFRAVVSQLPGYSYTLADFGSYADSIADVDYALAQKLAFVYKTSVIRKIRTYGVLRQGGSSTAYYNWSSGRFPYLMEATAQLDNDSARIHFVLLHAKANTGTKAEKLVSWDRRKNGLKELKDTLDAQYPYKNLVMLGDFNDDLSRTITTERAPDTTTSYIDFMLDTLHYKPLTLPLSLAGERSTASFSSVIDNVIGSDETGVAYLPGSARVLQQVQQLVNSYSSTTTDHYPVLSRYDLRVLAHPLPLEGFDAGVDGGKVLLSWNTPYEINAGSFVIERSRNLIHFSPVDTVAAHGTSGAANTYRWYDDTPWPGIAKYRLRYLGLDGSVQYSEVKTVLLTGKDLWQRLWWCLLGHQLQYRIDWNKIGPAVIQLIDLQGRVRHETLTTLVKGQNSGSLDISQLPAGVYFLRVQSGLEVQVSKVVVHQ
ncbi:T9SS-dependent choice-of-anchor J family protein [Chitinophaga qingshengii]|uniref:Ig-like domain-containing protein n=1 Tax=Chitinophaga qingshengii TaxID=1569794 RepID=A0ABR7TLE5_9BACT|nr:choice-of-anchor J domain-containing protein [Chitinophaga qingshengii]MBC9930795.1 Ig-like domain-containing protein [Chitinophaga qingshengii]